VATVAWFQDYRGRRVELTDKGWTHIVARHPDMTTRLNHIRDAVERPDRVMRDSDIARVEHMYRRFTERLMVRVIIIYRPTPDGWIGEIRTAHRTTRIQLGGGQLWP